MNKVDPTHLQMNTPNPINILNHINTTAAVFLGKYTAIALGGYITGLDQMSAHNISIMDFKIRRSVIHIPNVRAVRLLCELSIELALMERMELHAYSMHYRK